MATLQHPAYEYRDLASRPTDTPVFHAVTQKLHAGWLFDARLPAPGQAGRRRPAVVEVLGGQRLFGVTQVGLDGLRAAGHRGLAAQRLELPTHLGGQQEVRRQRPRATLVGKGQDTLVGDADDGEDR